MVRSIEIPRPIKGVDVPGCGKVRLMSWSDIMYHFLLKNKKSFCLTFQIKCNCLRELLDALHVVYVLNFSFLFRYLSECHV